MFRIKLLYRYIGREYVFAFLAVLVLCVLLMALQVFFGYYDMIAEMNPPTSEVFLYVVFGLPTELVGLTPQIALLAVLFGIGILSKNNEILAMHACGVSYTRLGFPVMICAAVASVAAFVFAEMVVPQCAIKQEEVDARIQKKELSSSEYQYAPTREWIYMADEFDPVKKIMTRPTILYVGKNGERINWKLSAEKAVLVKAGEKDDQWRFHQALMWTYKPNGDLAGEAKYWPQRSVRLNKHVDKLLGPERDPSQMNLAQLATQIKIRKANGENVSLYRTDMHKKLAFPFSVFILTLIGYTIAVRAHVRSMVVGFSYGLTAGVLYYFFDAVFQSFGQNGIMNSVVAAWLPNAIFLGFAVYRLRYINQVKD